MNVLVAGLSIHSIQGYRRAAIILKVKILSDSGNSASSGYVLI